MLTNEYWKVNVAYNFNFHIENDGRFKVTSSDVNCKSANIS